jgi:hypothetical protein
MGRRSQVVRVHAVGNAVGPPLLDPRPFRAFGLEHVTASLLMTTGHVAGGAGRWRGSVVGKAERKQSRAVQSFMINSLNSGHVVGVPCHCLHGLFSCCSF